MQLENAVRSSPISPRAERMLAAGGVAAMAGGCVAVALLDPSDAGVFPVCPLFTMTGLACPGCGLTRGFHALFRGDVITAVDFNAMIPIWSFVFGWAFISLLLLAIRGRGLKLRLDTPYLIGGLLVTMLVFGVLRNIPVWPLTVLYP
ncbi:MAG: DUF2752 domain-containing protein [Acidobacteriota bacterium]|nr:MAG: DUF2752 domain-containing protein [Acidobacteriota bacterium]